jgi:hypothetical protein
MKDKLSVGTWVLMPYGYEHHVWYVYEVAGDMVLLGNRRWLVSGSKWFPVSYLNENARILGKGKVRWWWFFLPWRNLICPFTKYRNLQG